MQLQKVFFSEQVSAANHVVTAGLMNTDCFDIDYVAFSPSVQSPSANDRVVRPQVSTGTTRGGAPLRGKPLNFLFWKMFSIHLPFI